MTTHGKCLLGTLLRDRAAEVFIWAWFHRQPLLSMHQNFVVQEPKQVFSINHSLYKQVRCREPLLLTLGMVGTLLKSRFPDASHGPTLQAGLSDDGSLRSAVLINPFRHSQEPIHFLKTIKQRERLKHLPCLSYVDYASG